MARFKVANVVVLVVVIAAVAATTVLLALTVSRAQSINDKAANIARTGRGINVSTDSIMQLQRTNQLAVSILHSAQPLHGQLAQVVNLANGINGEAGSINSTAGSILTSANDINSTAHTINGEAGNIAGSANSISSSANSISSSAGSINSSAAAIKGEALSIDSSATGIDRKAGSIVTVARRINTDVKLINGNLDVTIGIARAIKGDTGNILAGALSGRTDAACIDYKLYGQQGTDGQCQSLTRTSPAFSRSSRRSRALAKRLRRGVHAPPRRAASKPPTPTSPPTSNGAASAGPSPQPGGTPPGGPPPSGPVAPIQQLLGQLLGGPGAQAQNQAPGQSGPLQKVLNLLG